MLIPMRIAVVCVAAALIVGGTLSAPSAADTARPALRVRAAVVHGSRFRARELVRVSFTVGGESMQRRVLASSTGTFAVALPHRGKCIGTLRVVARGASGDTAGVVLRQPTCSPLP